MLTLALGSTSLFVPDRQTPPGPTVTPVVEPFAPAHEMRRLQWMIGTWQALELHEATEWGPAGGGRGTQTVSAGPGGFSLLTDYKSSGPQGQIAGHGILAWDPERRAYAFYLADSTTPGVMELACEWKKEDLNCDGKALFLGTPIFVRWTLSEITPRSYTAWFEASPDGKTYRRAVTFRYTRAP